MDGRIQEPTIRFLKEKYSVDYVDAITEPGPCKILAENRDESLVDAIVSRVNISIHKHGSQLICISGHFDCAGNPVAKDIQIEQVKIAMGFLKGRYPDVEVKGIWIDENWQVIPVW
jgi:hypothetical protein